MEEMTYRQSRLCRLLGNPVTFSTTYAVAEKGEIRMISFIDLSACEHAQASQPNVIKKFFNT
ncbi:MAG: hypothetical protein ACE5JU_09375 [Candidatus Binatia bacterium]